MKIMTLFYNLQTKLLVFILAGFTLPKIASAETFKEIAENVARFIGNSLLGLMAALVISMFAWNSYRMMASVEGKREEAKQRLIWSIILLFLFFGVWGIISQLGAWLDIGVSVDGADVPVDGSV